MRPPSRSRRALAVLLVPVLLLVPAVLLILAAGSAARAAEAVAPRPVPRVILALYDSKIQGPVRFTDLHRMAEMPLNQLGLVVRYHDMADPLPPVSEMGDVRGVLTWFQSGRLPHPKAFLRWARQVAAAGKRFVILGDMAFGADLAGHPTPLPEVNAFLGAIGLRDRSEWVQVTYRSRIASVDPRMAEFERPLGGVLPAYEQIGVTDPDARSYLVLRQNGDPDTDSHMVVVTSRGGYVAPGYIYYRGPGPHEIKWYINPFRFFAQAFATADLPKPDTTTLDGRRIFYSHIDGDGWRNVSEIARFQKTGAISAEVIYQEVLKRFSGMPVSVAPIAADLDPRWDGTKAAREAARRIFALPNVQPSSHTYSHPFFWNFYRHYTVRKEAPFLERYRSVSYRVYHALSPEAMMVGEASPEDPKDSDEPKVGRYDLPRAYLDFPFDLTQEIAGSARYISTFAPPGKPVRLIQWSGDTNPFPRALDEAAAAGLANINGGDTRFDNEYDSYAWVAPLGRRVGDHWQVYASDSNENTYTELWTGRYFGFRYLTQTFANTETPIRVKPFNIYYHMYSGQKPSSLEALIADYEYVRRHPFIPITAGHFSTIVQGFYSTRLEPLGPQSWRVLDRGRLQTLRFDDAVLQSVDFTRSAGVLGQRHFQGSLYVALDPAVAAPVVTLTPLDDPSHEPAAARPYLIASHWPLRDLRIDGSGWRVTASGFGNGDMAWRVPRPGIYRVTGPHGAREATADSQGVLRLTLPAPGPAPVTLSFQRIGP